MNEKGFRTVLFVALLLVAPALLYLVQVVFIVPPVFLLAGLVYTLKKAVAAGFSTEQLAFLAFFLVHFLLFAGAYWLLAGLLGRLARLVPRGPACYGLLVLVLAALGGLTQLPIYGGGGHGPARLGPLQHLLIGLEQSYGPGSMLTVYLSALGLVVIVWGGWWWRKQRNKPAAAGGG